MYKKTIKSAVVLVMFLASLGSFLYLNFSPVQAICPHTNVAFEMGEELPESHSVNSPNVAILKKAVVIAKCFLYPTE